MKKNSLIALFLSFIPGAGFLYLNKGFRAFLYSFMFFGLLIVGVGASFVFRAIEPLLLLGVGAGFIWVINMVDIVIFQLRKEPPSSSDRAVEDENDSVEEERFKTILLSFIPGLGHLQLGLTNRGLTFLIGFFGLATMVFFVAFLTRQSGFIVFMGLLPIIWIYNIVDSIQMLNRKQQGDVLVDRTVLEDLEAGRSGGKKSKAVATVLAVFPGAGHMYLGLQQRGLQLMAAFLLTIYVIDVLRLSFFLFLIPLIWFYSFFDGLQKASKSGEEELEDIPVISYFIHRQKWIGLGLLLLGAYYLFDSVLIQAFDRMFINWIDVSISTYYHRYFQTIVVSLLLIGGGIKILASGSKKEA
ncbi:hypothetical protein [Desertibacillus haloalkaliphilus]|uniref:hypothetical protein n=1 Tax=Desertibacillus haloalkaliphilus TaxID=1328930 RepID=UPI001C27FD59|nr:hypothetical protein [Desertibacillus haloalkaliphilus]MBU8906411.1 hypothetical protein [Desertibacillus haloalkaliphilus]